MRYPDLYIFFIRRMKITLEPSKGDHAGDFLLSPVVLKSFSQLQVWKLFSVGMACGLLYPSNTTPLGALFFRRHCCSSFRFISALFDFDNRSREKQ